MDNNYRFQSVLFKKSKFTKDQCREWLLKHRFRDKGVDENQKNYYRYRQYNPHYLKTKGFKQVSTIDWSRQNIDTKGDVYVIVFSKN